MLVLPEAVGDTCCRMLHNNVNRVCTGNAFPTFRFSQESCNKCRKWTEGLVQGMGKPE